MFQKKESKDKRHTQKDLDDAGFVTEEGIDDASLRKIICTALRNEPPRSTAHLLPLDQDAGVIGTNLDTIAAPFHQGVFKAIDELTENLQGLIRDVEGRGGRLEDCDDPHFIENTERLLYAETDFLDASENIHAFMSCLERASTKLDPELGELDHTTEELLTKRDVLIEKGHELNCRIGYNALEKKLEETFIQTEKYTTMESARCFRDEAEENLRRTNDLIRIGNMRACQIDRDVYNEMENITDLFENYEKDRDHYVKELDLFCDVRRRRISQWLSEPRSDDERQLGEDALDFLSLTEKHRHMEPQVVKNALRMYSFNATLTFDREDNLKLMEELTSVQTMVNTASGINVVVPRQAKARTDLVREDSSSDNYSSGPETEENVEAEDMTSQPASNGRSLHRCPRKLMLNTDPVTDPEVVKKLDAALRWEDNDGMVDEDVDFNSEISDAVSELHMEASLNDVTATQRPQDAAMDKPKAAEPVHGDTMKGRTVEFDINNEACDGAHGLTKEFQSEHPDMIVTGESNFLHNIESSTLLPSSDRTSLFGVLRKRKSSLTNVSKTEPSSGHRIGVTVSDSNERVGRDSQERMCRGSDCTLRTSRPRDEQDK